MDFKWQPFLDDFKFLLQPFDNTFADIAEWSDIVGVDCDLNWVHLFLLYLIGCSTPSYFYMRRALRQYSLKSSLHGC